MKNKITKYGLLLLFSTQALFSTSTVPNSFWNCSVWGIIEDEVWLANTYGVFRIEDETKVESDGGYKAWIQHSKHGWMWIESADLDKFWWYSESLGWASIPRFNEKLIYSGIYGWLYYLPGSSEPRWFYDYSEEAWVKIPLGHAPVDYFSYKKLPEPLRMIEPSYPSGFSHAEKNEANTYGMTFHFLVDTSGRVKRARIFVMSTALSDRKDVVEAAQRALEASEFKPGIRNDEPATLHCKYRFNVRKTD